MKEQILQLRSEGKSFREIQNILGCSRGTISYHCSEGQKEKSLNNLRIRRRKNKEQLVALKGGKCERCGYDKCIGALDFHHVDESQKEFGIAALSNYNIEILKQELTKCILLCSNCHREEHFNKNWT